MTQIRLTAAEQALAAATAAAEARDHARAVAAYEQAVAAGAPLRLTARGHALALSALGRHDEAVRVFAPLVAKMPKDGAALNLMGILYKRAGQPAKAITALEQARKLRPQDVSPWHNLGNLQEMRGDFRKAAECYRGALKLDPRSAELWRLLGRQYSLMGEPEQALDPLRRAVQLAPTHMPSVAQLVQALQQTGRSDEARQLLDRLRAAAPDDPELAVIGARLDYRTGRVQAALAELERILARHPGHANAALQLSTVLGDADRRKVNTHLEQAVAAHPDSFDLLDRLVDSLGRSRYDSEAAHVERAYLLAQRLQDRFPERRMAAARTLRTIYMRVLDEDRFLRSGTLAELLPHWLKSDHHSSVHYELGQVSTLEDRIALVDWHRGWGRRVSAQIEPVPLLPLPALQTGRKLRVGFMSSDLRQHPVTYFALPLLEGHDPDRVEVFCYSFYEKAPDAMQTHIAGKVAGFRHWPKRSTAEVAQGIAADGLDILFELGGSTAMNKLEVMAHRPARLGASWLGYPHSAGLEQIDLILTDPYIQPEDPRLLIERPFAMPDTWVALSRMFVPHEITEGTPEARKGHLTFGTANNPYKYSSACLDQWAAVLRAVPGARFVFLRPEAGTESFVANSRAAFARRDVDPDRLDFIGVRGDHMRHYNEIDIALDSLPHVGGTTTCEALWMGVPTITLVGPGFPERLSYSNLSNAGLGDCCAFTAEDYVAKAAALAADPARRLALRHGLRAQIAQNPLGQPERFTKAFYDLAAKVAAE